MNEQLRLHRTLVAGDPDGIFRCAVDRLPVDEPVLRSAVAHDGLALLDRVVAVAERAPIRNGALAGLAVALKHGEVDCRRRAAELVPSVCRTGRDVLLFAAAVRSLGGFGRLTRRGLARWYLERPLADLTDEPAVHGWRHRDVLRLCHVRAVEPERRDRLGALARPADLVVHPDHRIRLETQVGGDVGASWPKNGQRRLVALDASMALDCGRVLGEVPKRVAASVGLAAAAAGDEVVAFRRGGWTDAYTEWRTGIVRLGWNKRTALAAALRDLDAADAGPPDPALLVRYAMARKLRVDAFIVLAAGAPWTPSDVRRRALEAYRRRRPSTSMVVVGLKSGGAGLADGADSSWGIQGFEPSTPAMIGFLAGSGEDNDAVS